MNKATKSNKRYVNKNQRFRNQHHTLKLLRILLEAVIIILPFLQS